MTCAGSSSWEVIDPEFKLRCDLTRSKSAAISCYVQSSQEPPEVATSPSLTEGKWLSLHCLAGKHFQDFGTVQMSGCRRLQHHRVGGWGKHEIKGVRRCRPG